MAKPANATAQRKLDQMVRLEVWERMRDAFALKGWSINKIAAEPWAPSKPTVIKAVKHGLEVRVNERETRAMPPLSEVQGQLQDVRRAAAGAERVLEVVTLAAAGETGEVAKRAAAPFVTPLPAALPPALPPGPTARPGAPEPGVVQATPVPPASPPGEGVTPQKVLRELARMDGADTLADEGKMIRTAKATAGGLLAVTAALTNRTRGLSFKVAPVLDAMVVKDADDVRDVLQIMGAIVQLGERAISVTERVLKLEREIFGDPRDAVGATGAPGETFAMTTEEAEGELRRLAPFMEKYVGFPVVAGATAEIAVVVEPEDGRDVPPARFVAARDEEADAAE